MIPDLIQNVALLVVLGVGLQLVARRLEKYPVLHGAATGLLFGAAGIAGMMTPMHFAPGVIYDGRSIVLSLAGLFGGPMAAVVSAVMCGGYRLHLGGAGAIAGVAVIIEAAALGTGLYYLRRRNEIWVRPARLWAFGLLVHVLMLALQLLIPNIGWDLFYRVGPAVLVFFPLGFLLIANVFLDGERRRKTELALRESEGKYRELVENTNSIVLRMDPEGNVTFFNEYAERLFGYSEEEILGRSVVGTIVPPKETSGRDLQAMILDIGRQPERYATNENENVRKNGDRVWIAWTNKGVLDSNGKLSHILCVGIDITERKRAEEALRESEETHRALLVGLPDIVMRFDREGRHLFVSENVEPIVDIPVAHFIGKTHQELAFPEALCRFWEESIQRVFDTGTSVETEFTFDGKQGPTVFNWRLLPEQDDQGTVRSVLTLSRDITAQRRLEHDYETLFREMLDGFALHEIICDAQGKPADYRYLAFNPAFECMLGLKAEDTLGKTVLEVMPGTEPHWIETFGRVALSGAPAFFEDFSEELGKHFEVTAFRPAPNQFACIVADITDRKRGEEEREKLETRLRQAQKMEAIGTLAGGIAHDFNNILAALMGYTHLAKDCIASDSEPYAYLSEIDKASIRAKELVSQILAFSRQSDQEKSPLKIQLILKETLKLLRETIPATITLDHDINPDCRMVLADPTQLHQVIMNLCTNAYHAMREEHGTLTVRLDEIFIDAEAAAAHRDLGEGPYVRLTVSDTGHGMEEVTMAHIFDPYYTTKEVGDGTGLGLATVLGIVTEHGGAITVQSKPGEGATFEVFLPVLVQGEGGGEEVSRNDTAPAARGKGEHILFVDDEASIVNLNETLLERLGYKVTPSTGSMEALEAFRANPGEFDIIISDMTMPRMTGLELATAVLAIRPDIPFLLCTGYSEAVSEEAALAAGIRDYVMKPVRSKDLATRIRRVLDEPKTVDAKEK